MGTKSLLPSIPLLEENIARLMVIITWKAGLKEESEKRFTKFIALNSSDNDDDPEINALKKIMLEQGAISYIRLESFRLHRKLTFTTTWSKRKAVIEQLKVLWDNVEAPADIRIKAGYEWAYFYRKNVSKRNEAIQILQSIVDNYSDRYPVSAQKSLYLIAMMHNSGKRKSRDREKFFEYMQKIIDKYPHGQMADDALYQLASEYLFYPEPDWKNALKYFQQLREFNGPNDRLDSAYFLGAITYMNRNEPGDLSEADKLLQKYLDILPNGFFHLRCRFWRARIAESEDRTEDARRLFSEVIELAPYGYYGIRSQMHRESGKEAINSGFPKPGSDVWVELNNAYNQSSMFSSLSDVTPFHRRLANHTRLYAKTKSIVDVIGKEYRNRLDNIEFVDLDKKSLMPAVTLLLAFRQDAVAAKDSFDNAENSLRLAGFFGTTMNDWPMALSMLHVRANAPQSRLKSLMHDSHYLATAYPSPAQIPELLSSIESAVDTYRWGPEGKGFDEFSKSLMYSIIRRESSYFSAAISDAGAIGLFQLLPSTYNAKKLELCQAGCEKFSPFNPVCNVHFWACWVKKEKLMRPPEAMDSQMWKVMGGDDPRLASIFGLVKHNAGSGTLKSWIYEWGDKPMANDLEMKIDTFRFYDTQSFVRRVFEDVAIIESSGKFSKITSAAKGVQ
jgi:tetratricopeptide (TPR) repeat protein